jgi:hypothetical protein
MFSRIKFDCFWFRVTLNFPLKILKDFKFFYEVLTNFFILFKLAGLILLFVHKIFTILSIFLIVIYIAESLSFKEHYTLI